MIYDILGYTGSILIAIMLLPQVKLTVTTQKTKDISLVFHLINLLAGIIIVPYALHYKVYPMLITNISCGLCNSIILYYCIKNKIHPISELP